MRQRRRRQRAHALVPCCALRPADAAPPDTPHPRRYGCLVVNAPTANTVAAAEHGIALLAALARNVAQADKSMKDGQWDRSKYVGVSMVGKTLAIMGFGKVRGRRQQAPRRRRSELPRSPRVHPRLPTTPLPYPSPPSLAPATCRWAARWPAVPRAWA